MASEIQRLRSSAANQRRKQDEMSASFMRTGLIGATALAQGFAESKAGLKLSYFNIPTKVGIGTIAKLLEATSSSKGTRRFFGAIADAQFAAYAYNAARSESFIAGDDGQL